MAKLVLLSICMYILFSCSQQQEKKPLASDKNLFSEVSQIDKSALSAYPELKIRKENLHTKLKKGEKTTIKAHFKNTGLAPLLIKEVSSTCTCTVANFTDKPVKPNEEGFIDIVFDSHNKQSKQIYKQPLVITANTQYKFEKLEVSFEVID